MARITEHSYNLLKCTNADFTTASTFSTNPGLLLTGVKSTRRTLPIEEQGPGADRAPLPATTASRGGGAGQGGEGGEGVNG